MPFFPFKRLRVTATRTQASNPGHHARNARPDIVETRPQASVAPEGVAFLRLARISPRDAARLLLGRILGSPAEGAAPVEGTDAPAADVLRAAAALHRLRRRSLEGREVEPLFRAFVSEVSSWARGRGQLDVLLAVLSLLGRVDAHERSQGPLATAVLPDPDLAGSWAAVDRLRVEADRIIRSRCGRRVEASASNFDEELYLESHPDVRDGLTQGTATSGYDHFVEFGASERRHIFDFSVDDPTDAPPS